MNVILLPSGLPPRFQNLGQVTYSLGLWTANSFPNNFQKLFPKAQIPTWTQDNVWIKSFNPGVSDPRVDSLKSALHLKDASIVLFEVLGPINPSPQNELFWKQLQQSWREPAIEFLWKGSWADWLDHLQKRKNPDRGVDVSWDIGDPLQWGLEFNPQEREVLLNAEKSQGRPWTRCEWEVFAQSWSEHCKHKIFAAKIETKDTRQSITDSLFKTHIRQPTVEIMKNQPERCLSVFHDNAGVMSLVDVNGQPTDLAFCLKMETHNSPSAIAPYGGASTGVVGVHRDILGTGQGALPIAGWDVLCFENPDCFKNPAIPRPNNALDPNMIRLGVIKGVEDGGNQSGIPTVQGSIVFDPSYAIKPLVYAGCVGLLPKSRVHKVIEKSLTLYAVGGAVGIDGLRGAVMSSRDLRQEDFVGSAVQVANAFTQRRLTDFLIEARDQNLIQVISDNGAGGLSSSIGEMAGLVGGASIELGLLRIKYQGLMAWEKLLSESQERMSIGTGHPEAFEKLCHSWDVGFDRLGVLNDSGYFEVSDDERQLVKIPLSLLHEGCPQLTLKSQWSLQDETSLLKNHYLKKPLGQIQWKDLPHYFSSSHLCSRENLTRRFDHEVQGRTRRRPFEGRTGQSATDGSVLEIYENSTEANVVLGHGLAPWREDIVESTVHAFDEALRQAVISGAQWQTMGLLDNFSWPDPIPGAGNPNAERRLWRLVRCCEVLSLCCRQLQLPLVSGKDSMKNNSKDFEARETLVVSVGASGRALHQLPSSYFLKANDVILWWPVMNESLRDSVWERVSGQRLETEYKCIWSADVKTQDQEFYKLLNVLKTRYENFQKALSQGWIRSAKDLSEGGLLVSLFESSLGRNLGVQLERSWELKAMMTEGLGGILISVDPHKVSEVMDCDPHVQRLGVVINRFALHLGSEQEIDMTAWRTAYLKPGVEGFWG